MGSKNGNGRGGGSRGGAPRPGGNKGKGKRQAEAEASDSEVENITDLVSKVQRQYAMSRDEAVRFSIHGPGSSRTAKKPPRNANTNVVNLTRVNELERAGLGWDEVVQLLKRARGLQRDGLSEDEAVQLLLRARELAGRNGLTENQAIELLKKARELAGRNGLTENQAIEHLLHVRRRDAVEKIVPAVKSFLRKKFAFGPYWVRNVVSGQYKKGLTWLPNKQTGNKIPRSKLVAKGHEEYTVTHLPITRFTSAAYRRWIRNPAQLPGTLRPDVSKKVDCERIPVIPQLTRHGGICAFTACLMQLLFSQGARQLLAAYMPNAYRCASKDHKFLLARIAKVMEVPDTLLLTENLDPAELLADFRLSRLFPFSAWLASYNTPDFISGLLAFMKIPHVFVSYGRGKFYWHVSNIQSPRFYPGDPHSLMHKLRPFISRTSPEVIMVKDNEFSVAEDTWTPKLLGDAPEMKFEKGRLVYEERRFVPDSKTMKSIERRPGRGNSCHASAGITCNGERYFYNGWPRLQDGAEPCPLTPMNWLKVKRFFWDYRACKVATEASSTTREYSPEMGSATLYIREEFRGPPGVLQLLESIKKLADSCKK